MVNAVQGTMGMHGRGSDEEVSKTCLLEKEKGKGKEDRRWEMNLWQGRNKIAERPSPESNLVPSANAADDLPLSYGANQQD